MRQQEAVWTRTVKDRESWMDKDSKGQRKLDGQGQ